MRRRDIGERALVEEHASLGVADDARVLEHHDLGAVLALEQQLGVADFAALGHGPGPVVAVLGIHVDIARHVEAQQLVLRVVAQHPHERRVGGHELAVGRGLKDAGRDVLEELAVALLGRSEREQRMRPLCRVAQHLVDQVARDLVLAEEIERAAFEYVVADVLIVIVHQGHDRDIGGLGLDAEEGCRSAAVRKVEIEQYRIERSGLESHQPVREAAHHLEPVRLAVDRIQGSTNLRLFAGCSADQ